MSKTIHITESQYKELIGEMAYPSSFNFDEFRSLHSFNQRVRYCEQHLTRLSSGTSRIVYLIDNDKVLKLAKNNKGIAQNLTEIRLGNEPYYTCFAEIYEYSKDGLWVEMEYCQKAKKTDFKRLYGVPFEALCCAIYEMRGKNFNPYRKYKTLVDNIWNGEENEVMDLFNSICEYVGGEMLSSVGDLTRISSYGISKENGFVLIDYGLDDDVYDKFYRK